MNIVEKITFKDGEIELKVTLEKESVWLNRQQIATLFDRDVKTIGKHINNVFKEGELDKNVVVAKFATTTKHGAIVNKTQTKMVEYYNLDVIISVGYRVKSQRGVKFRQWATNVLKEYIFNGFAINREKITQQRLLKLEKDVEYLKSQLKQNSLNYKQGIFFDGEIFDAYEFISNLIKSAKKEIILIDNYIDESILTLFSKNQNIKVTIYTKNITKELKLDLKKYNSQYNKIEIKQFNSSHDRFIIIDKKELYHIGASLKDLGKKWFAFSKMDIDSFKILEKLKTKE